MAGSDEESMRVIVSVTKDGHPELYRELATIPAKYRAERLRSMGLLSLRGAAPAVIVPGTQTESNGGMLTEPEPETIEDPAAKKRAEFKAKLQQEF